MATGTPSTKMGISRVTYLKYTDLPGIIGERLFTCSDKDKDGLLNFDEFCMAIFKINSNDSVTKMRLIFDLYDFDGDGFISKQDMVSLMKHAITKANPQGDGSLDKEKKETSELQKLSDTVFDKEKTIDFKEYKRICEEVTSEIFLAPFILLRNKLPGQEQFCKFDSNLKVEKSDKIKLASPRVLSNYSFLKKQNSPSTFTSAIETTETPQEEEKLIMFFVDSLPVCKFNRMKNRLRGKATLLAESPNKKGEIFVCLCGKILVHSSITLCDDCAKSNFKLNLSGSIYMINEANKVFERTATIQNKDIFIYDRENMAQPMMVINLVDNYVKAGDSNTLTSMGKIYYGLTLQSVKSNTTLYFNAIEDKNRWADCISSISKCANINEYYDVKHVLGKGKFGVVREATNKKTGIKVAVKGLVKSKMNAGDLEMIKREIEIMRVCQHPNIVKLYDYFESEQYMFIVIEFLEGSDLINYFSKRGYSLKEDHCASLTIQMIKAIEYLHSNNIIHRDLKGENILMTSNEEKAVLKITDFGLSKIIGPNEKCTEPYGTIGYAAPELYLQKPYDKSVDIWGIGIVAYTLLSKGHLPFDGESDAEIVAATVRDKISFSGVEFSDVSSNAKDFLLKCLIKDPAKRLTFAEMWAHPWIKAHNKQ